jgi:hypothetical protein
MERQMRNKKNENRKLYQGSTGQLMTIMANKFKENPTRTGPTVDPGSIRTSTNMASISDRTTEKNSV